MAIKYPIGVQNFEKLIRGGYLYIDKTAYIRDLVENGAIYFLGRPRRFGKSLLLSTMHAFFEGKRELFKGLYIDSWKEWDWNEYPVIHIDLNAKDYTYKDSLYERINESLEKYEQDFLISEKASSLDERFRNIIRKAYESTGRQVVVLIDEYDKPILDTIHDAALKDMHRDSLRAFYATLKSSDQYLKFCFLTGVTKFGQMNVFSGLNSIEDISLRNEYAGICGITQEELQKYFSIGISECAREWNCREEDALKQLKRNYDGYHFSKCLLDVYNPWSALNAIKSKSIESYWNQTGGGLTFLYKILEAGDFQLSNLEGSAVTSQILRGTHIDIPEPISVLYQTGYLTICGYDIQKERYILGYPNREVESGFLEGILPAYSGLSGSNSVFAIDDFVKEVERGDTDGFLTRMQAFFDGFPYENALKSERDFQNIMYCVARLMGLQTKIETHSSRGSADMIIETAHFIYILEFKVNLPASVALAQIEEKGYAKPYAKDPRRLIKIGLEFSTDLRNIKTWESIQVSQ